MKINGMASIFLLFMSLCHYGLMAQFKWAEIGVNGLTCSQCSRNVEMSIRNLNFVEDIEMDLEHTQGKITFKKDMNVDIERISKAVLSAGFNVRFLKATFIFNIIQVSDGYCFNYENSNYQFIDVANQVINGETTLTFLGERYLPKKEFKKWKNKLKSNCITAAKKGYFVTI